MKQLKTGTYTFNQLDLRAKRYAAEQFFNKFLSERDWDHEIETIQEDLLYRGEELGVDFEKIYWDSYPHRITEWKINAFNETFYKNAFKGNNLEEIESDLAKAGVYFENRSYSYNEFSYDAEDYIENYYLKNLIPFFEKHDKEIFKMIRLHALTDSNMTVGDDKEIHDKIHEYIMNFAEKLDECLNGYLSYIDDELESLLASHINYYDSDDYAFDELENGQDEWYEVTFLKNGKMIVEDEIECDSCGCTCYIDDEEVKIEDSKVICEDCLLESDEVKAG
jgi:hypothetical protein